MAHSYAPQCGDPLGEVIRQACQDVSEPSLGIDVVELGAPARRDRLNASHWHWVDWDGSVHPWRAVDVERAYFALGR